MGVFDEFLSFKNNYNIGADLIGSIGQRYRRITARLNTDFWNTDSSAAHSLYVGSYGRDTAAKGISDLDIGFCLPYDVYVRYNAYQGNGQSALLQAVRGSLLKTYNSTRIGSDGQVVVISFTDKIVFEVLPYFENKDKTWTFADSNGGGSWKVCNPRAEIAAVQSRNLEVNRNLKALCRMMRVWRDHNNVPMSGALIDSLAYQFIWDWGYKEKSYAWHDFMARDFLKYLYDLDRAKTYWRMPGSNSFVYKTGEFWAKAKGDYDTATEACNLQSDDKALARRMKWRHVFGPTFPI